MTIRNVRPNNIPVKPNTIKRKPRVIAEKPNIILKKRKGINVKRRIIPVREMLTGLKNITTVRTRPWMTIKLKCAMPPMRMTKQPIIYARLPMHCVSDR